MYHAMDLKVYKRRKTAARKTPPPAELLDELVTEILLRLPVRSLLRFKSVSKAWRATISDPFFIRSHLRQSASRWRRNPSLLVTPHALNYVLEDEPWPTTFSTNIRFYEWHASEPAAARFAMHGGDFRGEFNSVCYFAHCDGLVVAPTDTNVYLFNPATREAMTLPDSDRNKMYRYDVEVCPPVGLGRDPRTGRHKVVRAFYRSRDPVTGVHDMGMEVFTVGGDAHSWRQTAADPPYPVAEWSTAVFADGALFWVIEDRGLDRSPQGLLRLSLDDDESFSVTRLPDSLDPALDDCFNLDEVHGELCLTAFDSSSEGSRLRLLKIWTLVEEGARWEHRYSLPISAMVHPVALLPGGGEMMVRAGQYFCRYDLQKHELATVCTTARPRSLLSLGEKSFISMSYPTPRAWSQLLVPLLIKKHRQTN
uniref:Uncharacterized protein n=1 Tax=Avena sativa TaxID=4498 RepID=A0ACD5VD79_AVESA